MLLLISTVCIDSSKNYNILARGTRFLTFKRYEKQRWDACQRVSPIGGDPMAPLFLFPSSCVRFVDCVIAAHRSQAVPSWVDQNANMV